MYMLDTNICIFVLKNRPEKVKKKFKAIKNICISSVTYGEWCAPQKVDTLTMQP